MSHNILITGAAGYIGGSLVADLLVNNAVQISKDRISAIVRSDEQAKALAKLGVNVLQLDLTNDDAIIQSILQNQISIVVHTASSIDPSLATRLIAALSKQKEASGQETYFIHTSGVSAFFEKTGWPSGTMRDTGPIFEIEKQLADTFAVRKTDVAVIEFAKSRGVTSFIVVATAVYGKGRGEWNKLSLVLPVWVKTSILQGIVHRFPEETRVSGVHISDLTALYLQIIQQICRKEKIPSGTEGYYFAMGHDIVWPQALAHLARALHARGLVSSTETKAWLSDEVAAKALGVPVRFLQPLWNAGENIVCERAYKIGWRPMWDNSRFLQNIDNEVQAVLDSDGAKSSLVKSLFDAGEGRP